VDGAAAAVLHQAYGSHVSKSNQCTCNAAWRRGPVTAVVAETQYLLYILSVCVCIINYPACSAPAPYCHLWSVRLCHIFPRYLINGTIFGEKNLLHIICAFLFSETLLTLRRIRRDIIITVHRSSCEVPPFFLPHCHETRVFSTDFQKNTRIPNFMKIRPVGTELFHADKPDRHDEANSRFSKVCERTQMSVSDLSV